MKPLAVLDHLHPDFPAAPLIDISHAGLFIQAARETPYDPRGVKAPAPVALVGLRIETLAHSLSLDPFPPFFLEIGHPTEIAFVICDLPNLTAFPFVVLRDGRFGDIDTPVTIDDAGEIVPERRLPYGNQSFDLLLGRWFRAAVDCFFMLRSPSARLDPVPLDLTHGERRKRKRRNLPEEYLQIREVKNG